MDGLNFWHITYCQFNEIRHRCFFGRLIVVYSTRKPQAHALVTSQSHRRSDGTVESSADVDVVSLPLDYSSDALLIGIHSSSLLSAPLVEDDDVMGDDNVPTPLLSKCPDPLRRATATLPLLSTCRESIGCPF